MPDHTPDGVAAMCAFERVRVIALRAAQLMEGCTARLPASHRAVLTARREVDAGLVRRIDPGAPLAVAQAAGHER